jgi:hypothetical protein
LAQAYRKQCGGTLNVTERVNKSSWLLGSFVTQVAVTVVRLTLIVKRNCGSYANGKRRKRGEDTAPLSHMKSDCRTSVKDILLGFFNGILGTGEISDTWFLTKVLSI